MPYTIAHTGFSIGVKRKWFHKLSLNGLLMGSITPDFDILFKLSNPRLHLFFFDFFSIFVLLIPLTLLLSLFFHFFIRNTIIDSLPQLISDKLQKYKHFNYWNFLRQNFLLEVISILLALTLHFSLDYITHWDAYMYMLILHIGIYPSKALMPYYYYFGWYFPQIFTTLVGFYFLYLYTLKNQFTFKELYKDIYWETLTKKLIWMAFLIISFLFAVSKLIIIGYEGGGFAWHSTIIYLTSGLFFSFFFTPIIVRLIQSAN